MLSHNPDATPIWVLMIFSAVTVFGYPRIKRFVSKYVSDPTVTKPVFIHPVVGGWCCRCDTFDGNITNGKPGAPCAKGRPACSLLLIE